MWTDFTAYIVAISRHWGPLATGVGALVVTVMVEKIWPEQAPWWVWVAIVLASIIIASFLAWRDIKCEKEKLGVAIQVLNTPSVSLALHKIDEDLIDGPQTLFIEVTGVGIEYVRPEVFAMSVEGIGTGKRPILCAPGIAPSFGVRRGEPHNVAAVIYDPRQSLPLRVVLPCKKITSNDYPQGEYYRIKIYAFAGPKEAELNIEVGTDGDALWARAVGSSDRLVSDLRSIAMKGKG
jgi:hypothetical protein